MSAIADPTYPLYPIASILAAAMLLLVLLTSFIRQKWNLGVAFLCFWLFAENLTNAINAIIWADNADTKFYVYCDIVSHVELIAFVVKPMATLIITRRLYLMADLQPVQLPGARVERRNLAIEWTLGLVIPMLVAGPFLQLLRFQVTEGFGCQDAEDNSILALLLIDSWSIIPPILSISIYYRWTFVHTDWEPEGLSYAGFRAIGMPDVAELYLAQWTSPILAFVTFALFGVTSEARASYWQVICTVGGWFGWKLRPRARKERSSLGAIEFGAPLQEMSLDAETGRLPSFINPDVLGSEQAVRSDGDGDIGAHSGRWDTEIMEESLGQRDIHDEATV